MGWTFTPGFAKESDGWPVVEGGFIRSLLLEPLFWMGMVDIGYRGSKPVAYRLTPMGAWVLGVGPAVEIPQQEGRVIVQPNFEIVALDPISDRTLAVLDEFAERTGAERAIKYRLTRYSVYRSQRRGWTAARIIQTLNQMIQDPDPQARDDLTTRLPLPQNVVRTLEEWQRLHERITIHRQTTLLQAADAHLLDQLLQDSEIRARIAYPQETPPVQRPEHRTCAFVAPGLNAVEGLAAALRDAGYPAARTRVHRHGISATFSPARCIEIADDGQVLFTIPLPSIYLLEQLAPFTTREGSTGQTEGLSSPPSGLPARFSLTRSAIEGAIAKGMSIDQILERLRALHHGPLRRRIEIQVRAWGHYYGDAQMQTLTLLQLRDGQTLRELLSEPELADILHPFTPSIHEALAMVPTTELPRLQALLAERGIDVRAQLEWELPDQHDATMPPEPKDEERCPTARCRLRLTILPHPCRPCSSANPSWRQSLMPWSPPTTAWYLSRSETLVSTCVGMAAAWPMPCTSAASCSNPTPSVAHSSLRSRLAWPVPVQMAPCWARSWNVGCAPSCSASTTAWAARWRTMCRRRPSAMHKSCWSWPARAMRSWESAPAATPAMFATPPR